MHRKVTLLLSLVLLSFAAAHAKNADISSAPSQRASGERIKFGLKGKPLQRSEVPAENSNPKVTVNPDFFFECKPHNAVGLQICIGFPNIDQSKVTFAPFRSLRWSPKDYKILYESEPIIDSFALRIYPGQLKRFCIHVSYLKDKTNPCYRSVFGLDYEFDMGFTVGVICNKGLEDAQKIMQGEEINDLKAELVLGLNLAKFLL